ncbi:helix-turn-helix domain-containing protein [Mucilaginibacter sp.]
MYSDKITGANIKSARLAKNYSQDYIAGKLGISQNAYSKLELGYIRIKLENLIIIADVLNIPITGLIEIPGAQPDVVAINRIDIVPKILEIICQSTGMGFAAVARVTDSKWIACSVCDKIGFGLKAGDELKLETTICNDIRQSGEGVIIDDVSKDKVFANHSIPALYGFQSYISIPITRQDNSFFGTLCAIDPKPAKVNNPETIELFNSFADLISYHLNTIEQTPTKLKIA